MALRRGEIPSGSGVQVQGIDDAQVNVRNRWSDGSVKFALVSGQVDVQAGIPVTATLRAGPIVADRTPLTEDDLLASGCAATLQFADGPVVSLRALVGRAAVASATGAVVGGRVRTLASGPRMSAWLYCSPAGNNLHVTAWFEVRYYGGSTVQVLPWVENGWTRVADCAGQAGRLVFTLNGTTRFDASDVHLANHCRVVAQDSGGVGHWDTTPDLYVAPDPEYLQLSLLVPSYLADTSGSSSRLDGLAQRYSAAAFGQLTNSPRDSGGNGSANGDFDNAMAAAGYHAGIGLLPEWDAFYLTSRADQRAWRAVMANAMGYGRYGVHFRDELTLRPVVHTDVPNKTLRQGSNHNIADVGANQFGSAEILPAVGGLAVGSATLRPEYWAMTHHPSAGYLAYLLSGHEFFLELCQFNAGTCFLRQNNVFRSYGNGLQLTHLETVRAVAWALRSVFQAATISVDGSSPQDGFARLAANNVDHYHSSYVATPCGSFGVPRPYSNFQAGAVPARYNVNAWELDFWVAVWGYGVRMGVPVPAASQTRMEGMFAWTAQWIVGRLGPLADATAWGYNSAARDRSVSIAPSSTSAPWVGNQGPWFANWGEAFELSLGVSNATNTTAGLGSFDGNNGSFPDATSYWGNLMPAIAYAVDLRVPGAVEAYARLTNAPNWTQFANSAVNRPVWAIRPRNAAGT